MTYVVKKGDNLTKIAKQNGLTLKQLLSLNKNIENPDYIQIGQKINLETKSPTGKSAYDNNDGYPTTPVKKNTPTWDRITKGAGNPATVANFNKTPEKKAPIKKQVTQKEEPGFLDSMKNKIYETYQDAITAIDQQTSKKVVAKPKVKIDDSFIDYGYKELGTYKDQSFKAGKNDSLLSAMNVFDNDKGFDYIVSPKVKEGKKTFNNVKGVAHFLMDSDITPNQKYTTPYIEKGNNIVKSAQAGKFTPYLGTSPDDYVMYYKNTGNDKVNVKYGQLKDKDKYKGYEQIKVRSVPFGELDFNNKKSAGFAKKASYIGTLDGEQTSIITDPESNEVYGRFSGGSGIFYFKEPKTGKTISVDVSGSVNTIKQVGEELSKKYNVDPKQLQFLYHDMGSYSAKPKSHNGVISNEQWENYNVNNKGYSGAALMYPMEYGGEIKMEHGGWIKKAIKHPGRCTPGSPNYDCPKGSPQWNLAQRFKHGDLHKKEDGGQVEKVSNLEYSSPYQSYTDPHPKVLEGFKKNYYDSLDGEYSIFDNDKYYVYDGSKPTKVKVGKQFINLKEGDEEYEKAKKLLEDDAESSAKSEYFGTIYDKLSDIPDNYTPPKDFSSFLENLRNESKERIDFYNDTDAYARYVDNGATSEKVNEYINKFGAYKPVQVRDFLFQNKNKFRNGGYATSDNIDMGYYTNPVKYFASMGINISDDDCLECGGKIKANKGINIENTWDNLRSKLSKKDQVKFEEWKSNLPDRLQNDKDYDLKGFFKEFGKNSLPEGYEYHLIDKYKLPNHPSFSSDSQYYNPETEYLGGKWDNGILNWIYTPNTQFKNKIIEPKSMDEVRNDFLRENHNILSRNPNVFKKFGGEVLPMDSYIKNSNESTDVLIKLNDFKERVPEYIYKGYLMSGKDGIYKGVDKNKFDVIQRTLSDGTITYLPYTYNNVQDNSKDFNSLQNKLSSVQIGVNQHKFGGNIKEEYYSNIKPINYYLKNGGFIKPGYRHIADEGFPNGQELTQPTTNYYNWGNYGNQNSFLTPDQINQKPFENPYQNMNLQQPNVPQFNIPKGQEIEPLTSIGAQKMTPDLQGIRNRVNQSMQDIAPKSKSPMNMNAVNMGLDIGTQSMSAAANLMGSLGKDNSKAKAFGQGASGAMKVSDSITKPFESIPVAGKAISAVGKTLGFIIGGALEARRQGIENEEMDKYNKLQEYTSRNTQTAQQPSYYGQYMSKYGSNIKNLEQRLVDDIFSDYDKFMKLT